MSNENTSSTRFRLIAQNRDGRLVVEIVGESLYMSVTANEVYKTPNLLNGFSPEHAAHIGVLVGAQSN